MGDSRFDVSAVSSNPDSAKTSSIPRLSDLHVGVEEADVALPCVFRQPLEQARAHATSLKRVGDRKGGFRSVEDSAGFR